MTLAELRKEYKLAALAEGDVDPDPYVQFERWWREAVKAELPEPNAMTLATASAEGRPSARIVLLKAFDSRGFVFFTNYQSQKARDLALNPAAALLFHWVELERQLRLEGQVEKIADIESDVYFASRPRPSQLSAWASPQSETIPDREWLEHQLSQVDHRFAGMPETVPRPPNWGGYRLLPSRFEFWQGRRSRLHDRLLYRSEHLAQGPWEIKRLAP